MPINNSTRHGWFAIACGRGVENKTESRTIARATDTRMIGLDVYALKFVLNGWLFIRNRQGHPRPDGVYCNTPKFKLKKGIPVRNSLYKLYLTGD